MAERTAGVPVADESPSLRASLSRERLTLVVGTVMTNGFQRNLRAGLPASLKQAVPPSQLAQLQTPQLLLSSHTVAQVQQAFTRLGTQETVLLQQLLAAIRVSLSAAITDLFAAGMATMVLAFLITLFLKEIPLRKTHYPAEGSGGELAPMGTGLTDGSDLPDDERRRAALGLALALAAREALRPDADPKLLEILSTASSGAVPRGWTPQRRGRSVAAMVIEPLAASLLGSVASGRYEGPEAVHRALTELGAMREMEPDEGDVQEALAVLASAIAFDTSYEKDGLTEEEAA